MILIIDKALANYGGLFLGTLLLIYFGYIFYHDLKKEENK